MRGSLQMLGRANAEELFRSGGAEARVEKKGKHEI